MSIVGLRKATVFALVAGLLVIAGMAVAGGAQAALSFKSVGIGLNQPPTTDASGANFVLNADGTFVTPQFQRQAGSHPDLTVSFALPVVNNDPLEAVRDVDVDLPVGFAGGTVGIAECDPAELSGRGGVQAAITCPTAAQVGIVEIETTNGGVTTQVKTPLFNLRHGSDVPARFGFNWLGVVSTITPRVRAGDYGISSGSFAIAQAQPIHSVRVTLWGVPADPIHDSLRAKQTFIQIDGPLGGPAVGCEEGCSYSAPVGISPFYALRQPPGSATKTDAPQVPLLTAPTNCDPQPKSFAIRGDSWEAPGAWDTRTLTADESGVAYVFEGCDRVPFNPSVSVRPLAHAADSPTGIDVELTVPQPQDPHGIAPADVRDVKMTFPEGMAVNASSAAGLGSCAPEQIGLGSNDAPSCPVSSKLGTVSIKTPLLEETLEGGVYLAKQNDNPFGSLLALYIAVKGPGFWLKLPGKIAADQATGRLTATFENNPQLPFELLHLELPGGGLAALTTPRTCGSYAFRTELTPWSGTAPVVVNSPYQVNEGCNTGGFSPKLEAGTTNSAGGSFSPFILRVTRNDGESNVASLKATLPEGLLAKLGGIPLCPDAQAATGACPAQSQVGTVTVGAGSGSNPLYVPEAGKAPTAAYLAGPYKGAPYSLVVKVPAEAGPFNLGTVAVRNALQVNPTTTQVTAESDPLPQILQGIPIAYRDVRVEVNRPEFTVNPTSCGPKSITSLIGSAGGKTAAPSSPFQASGCGELEFGPSLQLAMSGSTKRAGNPALSATLKAPRGDANIASTTVILPKTVFIDPRHVSNPCTRVQFAAEACPAKSVLGRATAWSPLLDRPLSGPVYFRSNGGERRLPDLVADLNGQIHVVLVGFIDSKKVSKETSLVRTRFANVPDAPVSKFEIELNGGKKSLIQNSANLCKVKPKAEVEMGGQNGKIRDFKAPISVKCGGGGKSKQGAGGKKTAPKH